jgi:hypothetical protein
MSSSIGVWSLNNRFPNNWMAGFASVSWATGKDLEDIVHLQFPVTHRVLLATKRVVGSKPHEHNVSVRLPSQVLNLGLESLKPFHIRRLKRFANLANMPHEDVVQKW